jgi:iron complex transport system substrate-binding protein
LTRLVSCLVACVALAVPAAAQTAPRRIVSLAPSVTEVLFEAGLGPHVVGVTTHCRFPREVLSLPKVGAYLTPSYEALLALTPDLVITLPEQSDLEPRLEALRMPMLRVDHRSLDGIIRSIEQIGRRCGAASSATRAADALRRTLDEASRLTSPPRPRTLICFGRAEDFRRLYAAAPGTVHHDLIERAGGANVLTSAAVAYPTLSAEGIMRLDPDVIIEFSSRIGNAASLRRDWQRLNSIKAVQRGRVHVFTGEFLSVPGPRFVRLVTELARAIRGER